MNKKRFGRGFWKDKSTHREFFDEIGRQLGVNSLDDWYNISTAEVRARGGRALLSNCYDGMLSHALQAVYPDHKWQLMRFAKVPNGFWKDQRNHRAFFEEHLARELGIKHMDDWYNVTTDQVRAKGGAALLSQHYGNSLSRALQSVFPEYPWRVSNFSNVPRGYWSNIDNQRKFLDEIGRDQLGIRKLDDWYNVTVDQIQACGGTGMLRHYNDSLLKALQALYPHHPWKPLGLPRAPVGYWKDLRHQREFLDMLGRDHLGIKHLDDWYNVTVEKVLSNGGRGLLNEYNNSLARALKAIYPEHPWQQWRFAHMSTSQAMDREAISSYLEALSKQFNIQHLDDWYRVSLNQIRRFGGFIYIKRNGGLPLLLKKMYPHHNWDEQRWISSTSNKKSEQRWLLITLNQLFPGIEIMEDYIHTGLLYADTHLPMELDVYIPSLSLAFEYNGEQHYKDTYFFGPTSNYRQQDDEKVSACLKAGITLISVPYSWNGSTEDIAKVIAAARPDLIPALSSSSSSSSSSPSSYQQIISPSPSPSMPPSPPTTFSQTFVEGQVPRGFWSDIANRRQFFDWAAKQLNIEQPEGWYNIMSRDLHNLGGRVLIEKKYDGSLYKALTDVYPEYEFYPWLFSSSGVPVQYWSNIDNQRRFFDWVAKQLNIDTSKPDDWYGVRGEQINKLGGRGLLSNMYAGSVPKALETVYPEFGWLPWRFAVGVPKGYWNDLANHKKFFAWAAGQLGIRTPEDWYRIKCEDIYKLGGQGLLTNWYDDSLKRALEHIYPEVEWVPWMFDTGVPNGYWSQEANRVKFFEWAAKQLNISKPEGWYAASGEDLRRLGGSGILRYFNGSLAKALSSVYPEVDWQPWRFKHFAIATTTTTTTPTSEGGSGGIKTDLQRLMESLARDLQVEGHLSDWYRVSPDQISAVAGTGANRLIEHHGGLYLVLKHLYPDFNWEEDKFHQSRKKSTQWWLKVVIHQLFSDEHDFKGLDASMKTLTST